jgi:hypothetical protein
MIAHRRAQFCHDDLPPSKYHAARLTLQIKRNIPQFRPESYLISVRNAAIFKSIKPAARNAVWPQMRQSAAAMS